MVAIEKVGLPVLIPVLWFCFDSDFFRLKNERTMMISRPADDIASNVIGSGSFH